MEKKALKTKRRGKTAVIFPDGAMSSLNIFLHCLRIPDVMVQVIKIREIYRRYKMSPPVYLFGLAPKKRSYLSLRHLNIMSFAVSLGLYDRFLRFNGFPDFLIGGSPALLVSAKVKNYEKTLINMICEEEQEPDSIRVFKNEDSSTALSGKMVSPRFSLLYFSKNYKPNTWLDLVKQNKISRSIELTTSAHRKSKARSSRSVAIENLILADPHLTWFYSSLKKNQSQGKIISPTFQGHATFL